MKRKVKEWNRTGSRIGLSVAFAMLMTAILAPMITAGGGTTTVTGQVTVNNACAFSSNQATIQFGVAGSSPFGITAGYNTIGTSNTILITNTGQSSSNILIYSSAGWSWSTPTGQSVSNTVYNSGGSNVLWNPAASAPIKLQGVEIQMAASQVDTGITVNTVLGNSISLGLAIPSTTPGGSYSETITVGSSC